MFFFPTIEVCVFFVHVFFPPIEVCVFFIHVFSANVFFPNHVFFSSIYFFCVIFITKGLCYNVCFHFFPRPASVMSLRFQNPTSFVVSGPSGVGKSYWVLRQSKAVVLNLYNFMDPFNRYLKLNFPHRKFSCSQISSLCLYQDAKKRN